MAKTLKIFLILAILIFSFTLQAAQESNDSDEEFSNEPENSEEKQERNTGYMVKSRSVGNGNKDNLVIVEPRNIIPVEITGKMEMVPYRMRRRRWGQVWGISSGTYRPEDYELDQISAFYEDFYPDSSLGLIQLEAIFKRNYQYFSLGMYSSLGYFTVTSDVENFDSELTIIPLKLGFYGSLDTLWREPWVVPYAHGGVYTTYFSENTGGNTFNGTTLLAFYLTGGFMFQLDWFDDHSAREAYLDSGIENTFLFLEATYQSASVEDKDPNFNGIYASAGFKVEF